MRRPTEQTAPDFRHRVLGTVVAAVGVAGWVAAAAASTGFHAANIRFEQNATDGDFELVLEATGQDEGLQHLTVVAPNGRTVCDFTAPDPATLGIREFRFESPEPDDYDGLTAAYPEGKYVFSGTTASGHSLHGSATLSHKLPPTVTGLRPDGESPVSAEGLVITWKAVPGAASYLIELEQDDLGVKVEAVLPGTSTSFAVPPGFLVEGTEYDLGVGAVSKNGNMSVIETSFTTKD